MISFLIVCRLKLRAVNLVCRSYRLLEVVQVTLQLVVKRTYYLNLVISYHWQW